MSSSSLCVGSVASVATSSRRDVFAARRKDSFRRLSSVARSRKLEQTRRIMSPARAAADDASSVDYGDEIFFLKDAPLKDLIPAGPWSVIDGGVCAPAGFKAAAFKAGLRASGTRADCALIVADEPAVSAGCFTQNVVAAAPVLYSKKPSPVKTPRAPCL
jgi:glutamate N-acetyltransferase/amino-acid N-acetyltransferase